VYLAALLGLLVSGCNDSGPEAADDAQSTARPTATIERRSTEGMQADFAHIKLTKLGWNPRGLVPSRWRVYSWAKAPDGCRYLCLAVLGSTTQGAVLDGLGQKPYMQVSGQRFSENGEHYAYLARREDMKWVAVIDGKEGDRFDLIPMGGLVLSADGERGACAGRNGRDWHVYLDGARGRRHDSLVNSWGMADLRFSQDGKQFAYVARFFRRIWREDWGQSANSQRGRWGSERQ
jgi:hypothetical protein